MKYDLCYAWPAHKFLGFSNGRGSEGVLVELALDVVGAVTHVLFLEAAQGSVSEEVHAHGVAGSDADGHEDGEGEAGGGVGEPGALDGGTVEAQVAQESLGSSEKHEPAGVGGTPGLALLALSDGSDRHYLLIVYSLPIARL